MARICIITQAHLSTNPRVVKEADALSDAGHEVRVVAGDFVKWAREADIEFRSRKWHVEEGIGYGPLAPLPRRLKHTIRQRIVKKGLKLGLRSDLIRRTAIHPIAPDLMQAAAGIKADLYIAHYVAALPAAAHAARLHGAKYAFDAEDFHLGVAPDLPEHVSAKELIRAIEGRFLPGCS